jgi:hypothetical protein
LEAQLSLVVKALEASASHPSIECYFPIQDWAWEAHPSSTFAAEFVRSLRRRLKNFPISWLDDDAFNSIKGEPGTVFHEINPGLLYAFGSHAWQLVSAGVDPLQLEGMASHVQPVSRLALSRHHWIDVFDPQALPEPAEASTLKDSFGLLAHTPGFAEILDRAELI